MSTKQKSNALDLLGKARSKTQVSPVERKEEEGQKGETKRATLPATGDSVRHTIYLDPQVSRALRLAAASGDDPRGHTLSTIVNTALQEMGYGD